MREAGFNELLRLEAKISDAWEYMRYEMGEHKARQLEYHPTRRGVLVCGTIAGHVLILNEHEERGEVVKTYRSGYSSREGDALLGLCWFARNPDLFIAGSADGVVSCGNWQHDSDGADGRPSSSIVRQYERSHQLTSVSLNCLDERLLISGYSKNIRIDDVETGATVHRLENIHDNHINISRFARQTPSLFATSSFDRTAKLWDARTPMAKPIYTVHAENSLIVLSFSPDDHFLMSAAADNEVTQYLVVDGSTHMRYRIPQTTLPGNYTRSYYSATGAYIFAGSSEESVVNVLCAKTGDLVARSELYTDRKHPSLYIQSLRGDPEDDTQFCVLANYRDIADRDVVRVKFAVPADEEEGSGAMPIEIDSEIEDVKLPSSQLAHDMCSALQQCQRTDAVIVAHARRFACHTFILEARAPVVAARLRTHSVTAGRWFADITDLVPAASLDIFAIVLHFIYTDDVQISNLRCACIDRFTISDEEKREAKASAERRTTHASDPFLYDASSYETEFCWTDPTFDEREAAWRGPWAPYFVALCEELLQLATMLELPRLQSIADDLVIKSIMVHTVSIATDIALKHQRLEVLVCCRAFLAQHVEFVERFRRMSVNGVVLKSAIELRDAGRADVPLERAEGRPDRENWFADHCAPAIRKVPSFLGYAASPLLGNIVLLIGGRDQSHYHNLRCIYSYNLETNTWNRLEAHGVAPPCLLYHTCGALESSNPRHVFICEGKAISFAGGRVEHSIYVLDTMTMNWQACHAPGEGPNGRTRHSMVALYADTLAANVSDEQLTQARSRPAGHSVSTFLSFGRSHNDVSLKICYATPPNEKFAIDVTLHTRFILFGGYCMRQRTLMNDVHVLVYHQKPIAAPCQHHQPEFFSHGFLWMKPHISGSRPAPRFGHSAATLWFPLERGGPRMIAFAGSNANEVLNDVISLQIVNLQRMRWDSVTVEGSPPHPRFNHNMVQLPEQNVFMVFGGMLQEVRHHDLHTLEIDATPQGMTARWTALLLDQPAPNLRDQPSAAVSQETIFVFGGSGSNELEPHVHVLPLHDLQDIRWQAVGTRICTGAFDRIFHRRIPTLHIDLRRALVKHARSDVVLQVTDEESRSGLVEFPANKMVLAARSVTLQVMLDSSMLEGTTGSIVIQDVSSAVLYQLLLFLYTDKLHCGVEHLVELLIFANRYNVQRLVHLCEGLACEAIDHDNCLDLLQLADSLFLRTLQLECQAYIFQHWQQFAHKDAFMKLHPPLKHAICELRENPRQAYFAEFSAGDPDGPR